MLTTARRSTQKLAQEYRSLKARTIAEEGSSRDLDQSGNAHLRDVENVGAKTGEIKELYLTTDSKGQFDTGTYFKSQTMHWHGEKTMQVSTSFQERPDGLVETLEQRDMDGDGQLEAVTRQVFNPANYDGFNLL